VFGVVEVCWYGDDGVGDVFVEVVLGVLFQFVEDVGVDFLWGVVFVVDFDVLVFVYVVFD